MKGCVCPNGSAGGLCARLREAGVTLVTIEKNGSCLFGAASFHATGSQQHADAMREETVRYVAEQRPED